MIVIREIELPFDTQKQAYTLPDIKTAAETAPAPAGSKYKNRKKQIWDDKASPIPKAIDNLLATNKFLETREYPFGKVVNYKYPAPGDRFKFGVVIRSDSVMRYVKIYAASISDIKNLFKKVLYKQRTEHEASIADPEEVLLLLTKAFGAGVTRDRDSAVTKKVVAKFTSEFTKRFEEATGKIITDFGIKPEYVKDTQKEVDIVFGNISKKLGDLLTDKLVVSLLYVDTSLQLSEVQEVKDNIPVIKKDVDLLYVDICKMAFLSCVNYVREAILKFPKDINFMYSIYTTANEIIKGYHTLSVMEEKGISLINTPVLQGIVKTIFDDLEKRLLSVVSNSSTGSASEQGSSTSTDSQNAVTPTATKGYGEGGFSTGGSSQSGSSTNTSEQSNKDTSSKDGKATPESIIREAWDVGHFTKAVQDTLFPACEKSMAAALEALKTVDKAIYTSISRDEYAQDNKLGAVEPQAQTTNLFTAFDISPSAFPTLAKYTKNGDLPLGGSSESTKQSKSSSIVRYAEGKLPTDNQSVFFKGFIHEVFLSFENDFNELRKASIDALEGTYTFHTDFLDSPEAKKVVLNILTKEGLIADAKESGINPEVSIDENSYKVFEFSNNTTEAILSKPFKVISDAIEGASKKEIGAGSEKSDLPTK